MDEFNIEFNNINLLPPHNFQFDVKKSMATSEFGTSEAGGGELKDSEYGISENG